MNQQKKVAQKKQYQKPKVKVVKLKHKACLLDCSDPNGCPVDFED